MIKLDDEIALETTFEPTKPAESEHFENSQNGSEKIVEDGEEIAASKRVRTRRILSWAIILIALSTTTLFAYRLLYGSRTATDELVVRNDQPAATGFNLSPEQAENIAVESVQKRLVAGEIKSPGKVGFNTNRISPVLSQFAGRLTKLSAELGDNVRAGQVLGTIETPDIIQPQSDYQQALANERTARTSLEHATRTR